MNRTSAIYYYFFILCLVVSNFAFAQKVKSIQNALDKNDFGKVISKIKNNLKKDSLDAGTYYLYSIYYIHPQNKANYHLDSAYKYVLKAISTYEGKDDKYKYQLAENGIRANEIQFQKNFIDSTAYGIADSLGIESSYQYFLDNFKHETFTPLAISKRDSLAYLQVLRKNTYQAYFNFINTYPNAAQYVEAKKKYHDLLYKVKTERDDLNSLENFIEDYPESPYFQEAQLRLFNLFTIDNEIATYEKFINKYPNNFYVERAWSWIWYLHKNKDTFVKVYPQFPNKSFIYHTLKTDTISYYPFYDDENAFYGFMDRFGNEVIPAGFKKIPEVYLCNGAEKDFIVGYKNNLAGAVNLLGQEIAPFHFQEITAFTAAVVKTKKNNKFGLVHKTGFEITPPIYQNLQPLSNRLISYTNGNKKGLLSYSGRVVTKAIFDDIIAIGEYHLALEVNRKYSVHKKADIINVLADYQFIYDDFELLENRYLLLEEQGYYTLYDVLNNKSLFTKVQNILDTREGWLIFINNQYQIFNKNGIATSPLLFDEVIQNQKAFGVKINDKWGVTDAEGKLFIQPIYDTLLFVGNKGILLFEEDKKFGYFFSDDLTDLSNYEQLTIETTEFLDENEVFNKKAFVITKNKRGLYGVLDTSGKTIISNRYDKINAVKDNLFIVERRGKKGIVNIEGKSVVEAKYAGIVTNEYGFALLQNKNFGMYAPKITATIEAEYDMLLKPYGDSDSIFIAKKGAFGIINSANEVLVDFQFEDLVFWTNQTALVKHQKKWKLYDLKNQYFIPEVFDTFEHLKSDGEERIIVTYRSSGYGVLSSKYGRIIPEEYSNIINIGSKQKPLYFVERDVAQAGLYILLYIDEKGTVIKKQVLKEKDYHKIACSDT